MYGTPSGSRYLITDFTAGDSVGLAIWQVIESNITILCVSLVASKPLVMFLVPDGFLSRMSSSKHRQLLPRDTVRSKRMQNLPSQVGSDSGSGLPIEGSIELRRPSDSHQGSQKSLQYQNELIPYGAALAVPSRYGG